VGRPADSLEEGSLEADSRAVGTRQEGKRVLDSPSEPRKVPADTQQEVVDTRGPADLAPLQLQT